MSTEIDTHQQPSWSVPEYYSDDEKDYKIEAEESLDSKPSSTLYCDESEDEDEKLNTSIRSSEYLEVNGKKRILKQIEKLRKMKNNLRRQYNKDSSTPKPKKKKGKKDGQECTGISNAVREEARTMIETKLNRVDKLKPNRKFIENATTELENIIFQKAGEKVDKRYTHIAKILNANLNTLKIWQGVSQLILSGEIKLTKLFSQNEKFIEKCKYLEDRFNTLVDTKEDDYVMEEVEQVNRDSYLQKLEKDFERIRKENLQEVQKWMKNANIDKHEVAKLKENKEQEIKQHNNEMASRLSKLVDTTNEDDEDSTKADPDPTSYSQNASFHSQDSSQSCQNDKSSDSQKPKLRLKESPLKKCIEAIREDEDQK